MWRIISKYSYIIKFTQNDLKEGIISFLLIKKDNYKKELRVCRCLRNSIQFFSFVTVFTTIRHWY